MSSTSQRTPLRHADASQSGRPRSTSSTNWYWSAGRLRRNVSRSSGELTVIVQTVLRSACTTSGQTLVTKAASSANRCNKGMDERTGRKKTAPVLHVRRFERLKPPNRRFSPTRGQEDLQPPDDVAGPRRLEVRRPAAA